MIIHEDFTTSEQALEWLVSKMPKNWAAISKHHALKMLNTFGLYSCKRTKKEMYTATVTQPF